MLARITLLVLLVAATVLTAFVSAQDKGAPTPTAKQPPVEQLIAHLGSDDFETRDAARRALLEHPGALPALRKALRSNDAEVRRAAAMIIDELQKRDRRRQVKRAVDFLDKGEVDTFVDLVTSLEPPLENEIWQAMYAVVEKMVDKRNMGDTAKLKLPKVSDIKQKAPNANPNSDRVDEYHKLSMGRYVTHNPAKKDLIDQCLLVAKGTLEMEAGAWFRDNLLFINGDLHLPQVAVYQSTIICDGAIKEDEYVNVGSIIIGRDRIIARDKRKLPGGIDGVCVQNEPELRKLVVFFEPIVVGVEVREAKGGVRVKKVHDGKPFAVAGVKEGDLVTAIDGAAVDSPESFRKLLRAKRAKGEAFVLNLRRGDQIKEFTIQLQD